MTPQELIAQMEEQRQEIDALVQLWHQLFPQFPTQPTNSQFTTWLNMYGFPVTVRGLQAAQVFNNKRVTQAEAGETKLPLLTLSELIRYASGCMKGTKAKAAQEV